MIALLLRKFGNGVRYAPWTTQCVWYAPESVRGTRFEVDIPSPDVLPVNFQPVMRWLVIGVIEYNLLGGKLLHNSEFQRKLSIGPQNWIHEGCYEQMYQASIPFSIYSGVVDLRVGQYAVDRSFLELLEQTVSKGVAGFLPVSQIVIIWRRIKVAFHDQLVSQVAKPEVRIIAMTIPKNDDGTLSAESCILFAHIF
jgi:hypothetical protein